MASKVRQTSPIPSSFQHTSTRLSLSALREVKPSVDNKGSQLVTPLSSPHGNGIHTTGTLFLEKETGRDEEVDEEVDEIVEVGTAYEETHNDSCCESGSGLPEVGDNQRQPLDGWPIAIQASTALDTGSSVPPTKTASNIPRGGEVRLRSRQAVDRKGIRKVRHESIEKENHPEWASIPIVCIQDRRSEAIGERLPTGQQVSRVADLQNGPAVRIGSRAQQWGPNDLEGPHRRLLSLTPAAPRQHEVGVLRGGRSRYSFDT